MDNAAAATTRHPSAPAAPGRVVITSEWMRWNDVAVKTDTLPTPFDLGEPVDRSPTTGTSRRQPESS